MDRYTGLAALYDALSSEYDYGQWVACVMALYSRLRADAPVGLVLDLGCGTGRASAVLANEGYQIVGVDASPDMLAMAEQRLENIRPTPRLLCQDIRELDLGSYRFDLVMSLCDTLNYLTSIEDLHAAFRSVASHLMPGGVFVFDINTAYKLENVYGNNTYVDDGSGYFIAWENEWRPRKRLCKMRLNIFTATASGSWLRDLEIHEQRAHNTNEVTNALRQCGFTHITGPLAAFNLSDELRLETERVFYAARVG
jgi:SAM-dependent methyltransferase